MLKITANPSFWASAGISVPGEKDPVMIQLQFKHIPRDEVQDFFQGLQGKSDIDALEIFVLDWRGTDAPFSRENLDQLLKSYPASAIEIYNAFRRELLLSKAKNS